MLRKIQILPRTSDRGMRTRVPPEDFSPKGCCDCLVKIIKKEVISDH